MSTIPRTVGLAVKWASFPTVLALVMSVAPSQVWGEQFADGVARPLGYGECHVDPRDDPTPQWCSFRSPREDSDLSPVYLVGDSNAAHFSTGLKIASEAAGRDFYVATASACPLLLGIEPAVNDGDSGTRCLDWQTNTMRDLENRKPGEVVLGWSDDFLVNPGSWLKTSELRYTSAAAEKANLFEDSLANTVTALKNMGHEVILVQTVPHWKGDYAWNLAECSLIDALSGCNKSMPLESAQAQSLTIRQAVDRVASRRQLLTLDFSSQICPENVCSTWDGDTWLYRDSQHLSVTASKILATQWIEALERE